MKHTDFLNLNLPEDTDPVEVSDLSENFEAIDTSLSAGSGLPLGCILIWHGSADAVPPGWAVCDGTNGTPDLRDRFVLGGGGSRAVGSTGGAETHKLTTSEMPSHKHIVGAQGSATTGSYEGIYGAARNTNVTINSASAGGNAAHSIMPPYYVLFYIMKIA